MQDFVGFDSPVQIFPSLSAILFYGLRRSLPKNFCSAHKRRQGRKTNIESQTFKKESPAAQSAPQDYPPFYFMICSAVMKKESALLSIPRRERAYLTQLA